MRDVVVPALVVLLMSAALASGCASARPIPEGAMAPVTAEAERMEGPPSAEATARGLAFAVTPADAEILIDGVGRGLVRDLSATGGVLAVKPGIYQVSLKCRGYVTWRAEVTVGEALEPIHVTMVRGP